MKWKPTAKQLEFLLRDEIEVLFGGSAGGGKSVALLIAALQYVNEPNYSTLILRRQLTDAKQKGGLGELLDQWLSSTDAKFEDNIWRFPNGSTVQIGYLKAERDKYRYDGAQFNAIMFDELTHFTETQYTYMFSRLRRESTSNIPPRVWSATNPGGVGHIWVKNKFIDQNHDPTCIFIPSRLQDNPHIDQQSYVESLNKLSPVEREQKLYGNWFVTNGDSLFHREKVQIVSALPLGLKGFIRFWDKAATAPRGGSHNPDYTVGVKMAEQNGIFYVCDVVRTRKPPADVQALVKLTAELDGFQTRVFMEQEPGSSGVDVIDFYARHVLKGYYFRGVRTTGNKLERASPYSAAWFNGNVRLLSAPWNSEFIDEHELFPQGGHDDQVDAASGAFEQLQPVRYSGLPMIGCVGV
ncbi:MAG: phage terminase large subunit [Candidatus Bathyarchaeota archaeon]|nr:phage terminase large subunit [Candidatus Termiticorpusculum sp.]MCL2868391.1 phage terminase large subunit [Candidatus Termiticorpusculum sp.]